MLYIRCSQWCCCILDVHNDAVQCTLWCCTLDVHKWCCTSDVYIVYLRHVIHLNYSISHQLTLPVKCNLTTVVFTYVILRCIIIWVSYRDIECLDCTLYSIEIRGDWLPAYHSIQSYIIVLYTRYNTNGET